MERRKILQSVFETGIRAKSFEPHDTPGLEIVPDEECPKCPICNFPMLETFGEQKVCELCFSLKREKA